MQKPNSAVWSGSEETYPAYRMSDRSAPATAAARSGTLFRSSTATGFLGLALDPDDGKDQDDSHAFARDAIDASQPARWRICRKFNDGAHAAFSLLAASDRIAATTSLRTGRG